MRPGAVRAFPQGVAAGFKQFAYGSYLSRVAEVEVTVDSSFKVKRMVCAVDCGLGVNPNTFRVNAFRADRCARWFNHYKDGRVEQSNFDSYVPMRIEEVPVVERFVSATTALS